MSYQDFIEKKVHRGADQGFTPIFIPDVAFDFQQHLIEWSVRKGRAAIIADCGLGKTLMELAWAENVARHTDKPVLLLTPLAVGAQVVSEGAKFGIEAARCHDGRPVGRIAVTNYEKLNRFRPDDFAGVVCDESSILKSYDGATRQAVTDFMRKVPYRLLATATAAPNDYTELGTSSEALGYLGHMDMLARFFKNDQNNCATKRMYGEAPTWRFKGHAETPYWRWVASWGRALRRPSDLGFDDGRFILPPLHEHHHMMADVHPADGFLFTVPARGLKEQRAEKKRTIKERCEMMASMAKGTGHPFIAWCHLNDEGDTLADLLPDAVQISGDDTDDRKESAFADFIAGNVRGLITKPKIGAWGLNFQHCNHVLTFPSHSYEQHYQTVRRCWRFGQKRPVTVDVVMTEGERLIHANLQQKAASADRMFSNLVAEMGRAMSIGHRNDFTTKEEMPSWL